MVELVRSRFRGNWPAALRAFVLDATNAWCPVWIARNYEVQNEVLRGANDVELPVASSGSSAESDAEDDKPKFPHSGTYKTKFTFVKSGEPPADPAAEDDEPNPYLDHADHWARQNRPAWQQHSALGPNVAPEGRVVRVQPLEAHVSPQDYDYSARVTSLSLDAGRATWEDARETSSVYEGATLHRDQLGDDFQQLFVDIVLRHAEALLAAVDTVPLSALQAQAAAAVAKRVKPLRLLLLGTAGTGKTRTVQTLSLIHI